jgi:hypothetical protein
LKEQIKSAQSRYQVSADTRRAPAPEFAIGSLAFVKAQFFRTTPPSKKLAEKYLGPFEIIGQARTRAYILWLPDSLRVVHPVFYVSMLEHATPNSILNQVQSPPPPVEINGETEYEISEILNTKIDRRRKPCNLLYLVHWAGYEGTDEETSWVLAMSSAIRPN